MCDPDLTCVNKYFCLLLLFQITGERDVILTDQLGKNALPFVISMPSVKINQMPNVLHTQGTKMAF